MSTKSGEVQLNLTDIGEDVAVDDANNIYVTGYRNDGGSGGPYAEYTTIKYAPNGDTLWVAIYNPAGYPDCARTLLLADETGTLYVYVFGNSALTNVTNNDFLLIKYRADNGNEVWGSPARYDGGSSDSYCYHVARDADGNIIVAGSSMMTVGGNDYTTVKYDSDGNEFWTPSARNYNGPANKWDCTYGMAVDGEGNIYVSGRSQRNGDDYDFGTVAWDAAGNELWVMRYDGPAEDQDYADGGVVVDNNLNVYVTGNSKSVDASADYTTIRYSQQAAYICGDIDGSGADLDIADLVYLVDYMFNGGPEPLPMEAADVDGSGLPINIADLVYLVDFMFNGGPAPNCS